MTDSADLVERATVVTATGCYVANCALGSLVGLRVVDSSGFHWLHHALFGATAGTAVVAVSAAAWGRTGAGWALVPALVPWVVLPRVRAPSRRHVALALSAAPCYALALTLLRR